MSGLFGSPSRVAKDVRETLLPAEFKALMFFGLLFIFVGTVFYMIVEDWDAIEAFYFCVATLTTVGYGDLHPTNDLSRLFTAFYALFGVGFILTFLTVTARGAAHRFAARVGTSHDQKKETEKADS